MMYVVVNNKVLGKINFFVFGSHSRTLKKSQRQRLTNSDGDQKDHSGVAVHLCGRWRFDVSVECSKLNSVYTLQYTGLQLVKNSELGMIPAVGTLCNLYSYESIVNDRTRRVRRSILIIILKIICT